MVFIKDNLKNYLKPIEKELLNDVEKYKHLRDINFSVETKHKDFIYNTFINICRKRLNNLKDINIIIISFHVLTLVFTLAESYFVNRNIWVSWLTIALALTAVFLNGVIVSSTITLAQEDHPFNKNVEKSVASLILQVFAICLMTAYIFKLIRSKNKIMY